MSKIIVAHEIGHVCGLEDIYHTVKDDRGIEYSVSESITWENFPDDWGNTSTEFSFYNNKTHLTVIGELLMSGFDSRAGTEIPFGSVSGFWHGTGGMPVMSYVPVGVTTDFNRQPHTD